MAWVAAAMAGGSALQMGGSIFGGLFGSSAEKKRAAAIQAAGRQGAADIQAAVKGGVAEGNAKLDTARGDLSPFAGYGKQAGDSLMSLLLGGQTPAQLLKASDLFNFQSDLGSRNINRELSARGLYGSGAGLETLQRFNDQLVGEEGQRMFDRLFGVTQLGEGAAGSMADMTNRTGLTLADMIFKGGTVAANLRYDSAVGAAGARSNATQMLGQMGQQLFGQAGQGLMQYGDYQLNKPFMDASLAQMNKLTKGASGGNTSGMTGSTNPDNRYGFTSVL